MKRCIMVMFDSLNRHMLTPYNAEAWIKAPNFQRLAERSATFDTSYVCSMPCMPARRDFHTGRPNFLHTGWGPIEPYDDSVPEMLKNAGVHSHLATDHYHYLEDGGATYHNRYSTWECYRGQEGDPFYGMVGDLSVPKHFNGKGRKQDWVNRTQIKEDADYPQTKTFDAGLRFIDQNQTEDSWFLQIECFDPHEPFTTDPKWQKLYPSPDIDGVFDWPAYDEVKETPDQVEAAKCNYAALVSKCDASLGAIMDKMDEHSMWDDTMLIVWTDHGYLLGEHGKWAKNWSILYEQIAHTPFFIWDPRSPETAGLHRKSLVQPAIDLGPTLLDYFGLKKTPDMLGHSLSEVISDDKPVRDAAIFGYHGKRVNITDGRYLYFRCPEETGDCYSYTLMPTNMRGFKPDIDSAELCDPFSFTKGHRLLKIGKPGGKRNDDSAPDSLLYDLASDPEQKHAITDESVENRLVQRMKELMQDCDAPSEQYARMGL
ncbi:sulfatase [Rubellicoccus peritrichatus]|uniref:Sulfatase n=1 Tax=Rubellicoccus peritrichatus TaxID=3080537 RepID=A0AAQ3L8A3_9BACT|nr:sulfatase [Puniceicoccus sp. CR14]WOO40721.1 sulfatase [Puniceicoccus sp. CR14]